MADLELDLLQNALDSLDEALAKYKQGQSGDEKAYKFCVQHVSHFFELLLKYYVTKAHRLLVYKNPFAKKIDDESQTIGLHDAINFLKNEGHELTPQFEEDLKWLKTLRNRIEHHKFSMDTEKVQETIGRLITAVAEFDESHEGIDLKGHLSDDAFELFHELAKTYEKKLAKARAAVQEILSGLDPKEDEISVYECPECGHETLAPSDDSETGFRCTFCGNEESDDIEVACAICGQQWHKWQMRLLDWADTGHPEYYCPYCLHDPEYRKDD
jgi:DNA-directed RNA polymerase subunit RPC12/RpoP/exonuclease VII small subunit